jgi:ribose-phosphate pyrophosphokinase
VSGKDVIMIDDLVDTAGTMCKAADAMMEKGAKSVRAFCTHPVLSGKAYENLENSSITGIVTTDTIPLQRESKKIIVLSCAQLFARAIRNTHEYKSIAALFVEK